MKSKEVKDIAAPENWFGCGEDEDDNSILRGSWSLVPPGKASIVIDEPVAVVASTVNGSKSASNSKRMSSSTQSSASVAHHQPHTGIKKDKALADKFLLHSQTTARPVLDQPAHIYAPPTPAARTKTQQASHTRLSKYAAPDYSVVKKPLPTHVLSTVRSQLKHLKARRQKKQAR